MRFKFQIFMNFGKWMNFKLYRTVFWKYLNVRQLRIIRIHILLTFSGICCSGCSKELLSLNLSMLATSKIFHTKKPPSADWTYNDSRILVIVGFINLNVYTNVVYFRKLLKTSETISCYDKSQGIITCYFDFWYLINISWLVNVKYT